MRGALQGVPVQERIEESDDDAVVLEHFLPDFKAFVATPRMDARECAVIIDNVELLPAFFGIFGIQFKKVQIQRFEIFESARNAVEFIDCSGGKIYSEHLVSAFRPGFRIVTETGAGNKNAACLRAKRVIEKVEQGGGGFSQIPVIFMFDVKIFPEFRQILCQH